MIRKIMAVGTAALISVIMGGGMSWADTAAEPEKKVHKSYVCKYVGTPGENESLQTGQNPIWVANQSLTGEKGSEVAVGDEFSDKHGRSIVIVANTLKLDPEPGVDQCPAPEPGTADLWFDFGNPTCETDAYIDSEFDPTKIEATLEGTVGPGNTVTVTYSPKPGYVIDHPDVNDEGNVVATFTFDDQPKNCEIPEKTTRTKDKMNCNGVFERKITVTTLNGEVIEREVSDWKKVRNLTADEKAELDCKVPTDKPEPKPEPKADKPEPKQPELAATGANTGLLGAGLAAILAGMGLIGASRLTRSV